MNFARIRFVILACVASAVMALGVPGIAGATPTVGHAYAAIDTAAANADYSQTGAHDGYVILQAWETQRLHALKAQNPSLKVLVYKNLAFSADAQGGASSTGVSTSEAPDSWFLKNTSGARFSSGSYNWLWAMDVGSAEYQKRWTENVLTELETQGWDGVFMDDSNPTMKYAYDPSQVAKYPNDGAYSAAMESALAYIGPAIQAHGKLAIPNFAAWVEYPSTCNGWLQYVSGALDEMFAKWGRNAGEGYRDEAQWNTQLEEAKYAASQNKVFLAFTQGSVGETQAARFGYASLMLAANGNASYAFTPNYTSEVWMPEFEYELGNPTGSERKESSGVHRRDFEHGLVLVNPTGTTRSVTFGGTYSGSGLTQATATTMQPHTGLVLTGSAVKEVKEEPAPITVTGTVTPTQVNLHWKPVSGKGGKVRVRLYRVDKVERGKRSVARTSRQHRVDHRVAQGRSYRYRIVGFDSRGKIVAKSRPVRVRLGSSRRRIVQRPVKPA